MSDNLKVYNKICVVIINRSMHIGQCLLYTIQETLLTDKMLILD